MPYIGSSPNFGAVESQTITSANGSTATFTLSQYVPDSDSIIVTVGNVVQEPTTAYSAVANTITFTENVPNGDTIVIRYLGRSVDVPTTYKNMNRFKFVATGGQNTFQNNDANGLELSYTAGNIDVFMNGVRLDESDFTASNGTSVVLVTNASASDEIVIIAYKSVQIANALDKSAGGTVSGNTVFSGTLSGTLATAAQTNITSLGTLGTLKIGSNSVGITTDIELTDNAVIKASSSLNLNATAHNFFTHTSGASTGGTGSSTQRMSIDANGNVGIGLTASFTSGNGLHLADNFFVGFGNGANSRPDFQLGYDATNTRLAFKCGTGSDTTDMFFTTHGSLEIGTANATSGTCLQALNNSSSPTIIARNNSGGNKVFQGRNANGSESSSITQSGIGFFANGVSSDETLKNVKGEMNDGWSKLKDVQPKSFTWKKVDEDGNKSDDDLDGTIHYGVMAQDLKKVIPDLAYGEEGGMSVDYNGLLMVAINTIKELEARIKALEKA